MALTTQNTPPSKFLDTNLATFSELDVAKILILDTFKDLMSRYKLMAEGATTTEGNTTELPYSLGVYNDIKKFFLSLYFEGRIYTLFTPLNLQELAQDIFTNDNIRDFVLNWTDMCMIVLNVNDYSLDRLKETISRGICINKLPEESEGKSLSLVNEKVALSIQITSDYVKDILDANSWLICIVILYLFMSEVNILDQDN